MAVSKKHKILIAEDERDLLEMVRFRLEAYGFQVASAYDGEEAIEAVHASKPDLIILDLMLPKKDGYEVCSTLKQDERYQDIPIIIFSAKSQQRDKDLAMQLGASAYVTKPFEPQKLLAQINELLEDS